MKFDGSQYQHAFVRKKPSQWVFQVRPACLATLCPSYNAVRSG